MSRGRKLSAPQATWLARLIDAGAEGYLASPTQPSLAALRRDGMASYDAVPDRLLVVRWYAGKEPAHG